MKHLIGFLLFSLLVLSSPVECASKQKPVPAWTTNLRSEGYFLDEFTVRGRYAANRQIAFGSADELVVANDANTSFANPGPVTGYVLNANTGQLVNKASWQSKGFPFLFATNLGDYSVITEAGSTLYSAGLRTIKVTIPFAAARASPDGSTFAARKRIPGPHGLTYLLNAHTLKPTGVEFLDHHIDTICGDRIAYISVRNKSQVVNVLDSSGTVSKYVTDCSELRPDFLSPDLLVVNGCNRMDIIDTSNGLRFSHRTQAYDSGFATVSRDGSRFVVSESFYGRFGHEPKLRFERFTVIDVELQNPVFSIDIKQLKGRRSGASGVALSPDGNLFAVNSLGFVQLFALPEHALDDKKP